MPNGNILCCGPVADLITHRGQGHGRQNIQKIQKIFYIQDRVEEMRGKREREKIEKLLWTSGLSINNKGAVAFAILN